jgi:hypothetical protein
MDLVILNTYLLHLYVKEDAKLTENAGLGIATAVRIEMALAKSKARDDPYEARFRHFYKRFGNLEKLQHRSGHGKEEDEEEDDTGMIGWIHAGAK